MQDPFQYLNLIILTLKIHLWALILYSIFPLFRSAWELLIPFVQLIPMLFLYIILGIIFWKNPFLAIHIKCFFSTLVLMSRMHSIVINSNLYLFSNFSCTLSCNLWWKQRHICFGYFFYISFRYHANCGHRFWQVPSLNQTPHTNVIDLGNSIWVITALENCRW